MATQNLGNADNVFSTSGGEVSVDAQGGNDRLVINYGAATAPLVFSGAFPGNAGWRYLTDEAFNYIEFINFETFDITGGSEADDLRGGNGGDRLVGGGGDDTLYSGLGNDLLDGGAGMDRWIADYSSLLVSVAVVLPAAGASYTVAATGLTVRNVEALTISTGHGNDSIDTSAVVGDDIINTFGGNDSINSGRGRDTVDGGAGTDTLIIDWSAVTTPINGTPIWDGSGYYSYLSGSGDSVRYVYNSIERFNVTGGAGNDTLFGLGGDDTLAGGAGNDLLNSGTGLAVIDGGAGADIWQADLSAIASPVVINASGSQTNPQGAAAGLSVRNIEGLVLTTGAGNDILNTQGFTTDDNVSTGAGNDSISLGRGRDTVDGGAGIDTLIINWSAVTTPINGTPIWDGSGYYSYLSGSGDSVRYRYDSIERFNVRGGAGNDILFGLGGDDTLAGGAGNDLLNSGTGLAVINGGAGTDVWQADVSAIASPVVINALGSQTHRQGAAAGLSIRFIEGLVLTTGAGNDILDTQGFTTDDNVSTGEGDDSIALGRGMDTVDGGAGTDTLIIDWSAVTTDINGTPIWDGWGWYNYLSGSGDSVRYRHDSIEIFNVTGGAGNDILFGLGGDDTLAGGAGDDTLDGGAGKDVISGGVGNDRWLGDLSALSNVNLVLSATGGSTITNNGANWTTLAGIENITVTTGVGNDVVDATAVRGDNTINTGNGDDTVRVGGGKHFVDGGAHVNGDLLVVDFSSSVSAVRNVFDPSSGRFMYFDTAGLNSVRHSGFEFYDITGGAGHDRLPGGAGNDRINGGAGNDVLRGLAGDDVLTGGLGNDLFIYESYTNGMDTITDLGVGDTIRVHGRNFAGPVATGTGAGVSTDRIQLSVDSANNISTLHIGSDGDGIADVVIRLQGTFSPSSFSLSGRNITVAQGSTNPGTPGDDTLDGTGGNDQLNGGLGNDLLRGGLGNDTLDGGDGNDTLVGGLGADTLIGGAGADTFAYTAVAESQPGSALRDTLTDFLSGSDKINLSAIDANPVRAGDQAFTFIAAGFTGAAGQLRYDAVTDLALADVNGDGIVDLEIFFSNNPVLVATDFIL